MTNLTIVVFLIIIIVIVGLVILFKAKFRTSSKIKILINGEKLIAAEVGTSLLTVLGNAGYFLPSTCGGGGTCGQCICKVTNGGETSPIENLIFTPNQIADHYRLGCQVKVFEGVEVQIPEEIFHLTV